MDISTLTELITSLGFPIAVCVAMGFFIYKIYIKSIEQNEIREDKLMAELIENRKTNAEAISTIAKYAERLDIIQEDVKEIKSDVSMILHDR